MPIAKKRIVGTAGHIDHGKTSLVRALTGTDCDRLPEEKRRGITIDLGFANLTTAGYQIGFIDVPGHERFVKNMLAGVGGIDAAMLVVAADESIKPQTREHFAICRLLRIPTGLVAITKADLVEPDIVEIVRLEIEDLVRGSFLESRPIIPVSNTTGEGIPALKEALVATVASVDDRDAETRVFRLPIDRVFSLKGFGSVVTGTTVSGAIRPDTQIEILPAALRSRARAVHVHGEQREVAVAGERTSLNLPDIPLESLSRGEQVVEPGTLTTSQVLTVELELLPDAPPLKDQTRIRFHHFSAELLGSVRLLASGEDALRPGSTAIVQIRLESPVVAVGGDRFVIRRYSPQITIGGGRILDAHLGKLRRGTRPEFLQRLAEGSFGEKLELRARSGGLFGTSLTNLVATTGLRRESIERLLAKEKMPALSEIRSAGERRWVHHDVLATLRRDAMDFLKSYFEKNRTAAAVAKSEFQQQLFPGNLDAALVDFFLADLAKEKIIDLAGDQIDVPGRAKKLSGVEGDLARAIEERFREAQLKTPAVSELINTIAQKPKVIEGVIGYLVKTNVLVRLADGIYVHKSAIADATSKISAHKGEKIDVAWFKDFFGLSRKVAIPLLEYFDAKGVTRRVGDFRMIL